MSKKMTYNEAKIYVKNGGHLAAFSKAEIRELSETALNVKDGAFYDQLQLWYDMQKGKKVAKGVKEN